MPTLSRATAITGIGETDYTRGSPYSSKALNLQAASRAIEDAGLRPGDIDGVIPNSLASGPTAEDLIEGLGIADLRYSVTVQMGGASPIASIQNAAMAVACGVASNVLVVAGWNGYSGPRISQMEAKRGQSPPSAAMLTTAEFEVPFGLLVPMQWFALLARHHMCQYGTTSEQLGAVAAAERKHAMLNPKAIMKHPLTLEDHQASPMLAEPFHLLDCCLESDGATAVVVSAAETANDLKQRPVYIMGIAEGHPDSPSSIPTRRDPGEDWLCQGRAEGLRHGRALSCRHQARRDIRLLYVRGGPATGEPWLLRQGGGRAIRRRWAHRARGSPTHQHAWRVAVPGPFDVRAQPRGGGSQAAPRHRPARPRSTVRSLVS